MMMNASACRDLGKLRVGSSKWMMRFSPSKCHDYYHMRYRLQESACEIDLMVDIVPYLLFELHMRILKEANYLLANKKLISTLNIGMCS